MDDPNTSYYAGLDIGGTTIKSVLVNGRGDAVTDIIEVRSLVDKGYEATFAKLQEALELLAASSDATVDAIKGIGLDVPAANSDGVIWGQANLARDWVGMNIQKVFSERSGIPIYMTNDGNAAALGEYFVRHKHMGSLLYVAPGTGLAGGLVMPGGRIYSGANGLALEVGHISVPFFEEDGELPYCSCGWYGCLEAWVSLVALRRRLKFELVKEKWKTHPLNEVDVPIEEKAFMLRDYAEKDDPMAIEVFKQQGYIFGYGLADLIRVFDPGLVVIGGGLAETSFRETYLGWILEGFEKRAWPIYYRSPIDPDLYTTRFEWALKGDSAGALGMAYSAREKFGGR